MEGMKKLFLFALFLVGFSAAVQAQNLQVSGTVVSKADGFPVIGASRRGGNLYLLCRV